MKFGIFGEKRTIMLNFKIRFLNATTHQIVGHRKHPMKRCFFYLAGHDGADAVLGLNCESRLTI